MKKNTIVSLADSNYFELLNELVESISRFEKSKEVAICILDAGLTEDQRKILSKKVDEIKSAEWDIEVPEFKVRGKEWLKSQVSMAFLPKYFPNYEKYLWIDCDAWVNDWSSVELYFKACDNGKLGITQTLGPGYKIMSKEKWLFGLKEECIRRLLKYDVNVISNRFCTYENNNLFPLASQFKKLVSNFIVVFDISI